MVSLKKLGLFVFAFSLIMVSLAQSVLAVSGISGNSNTSVDANGNTNTSVGSIEAPPIVFYYDKSAKGGLKDFFDGKNTPSKYASSLKKSSFLANGLIGGQDFVMRYDEDLTKAFGDDKGEPFYSKIYYCTPSGSVSFDKPSGDYFTLTYAAGFKAQDQGIIDKNKSLGSVHIGLATVTGTSGDKTGTLYRNADGRIGPSVLGTGETRNQDLGNLPTNMHSLPQKCNPPFKGTKTVQNFYSLPEDLQKNYSALTGIAASLANSSNSEDGDQPDCESSSGIGWIICPIVDLAANTTDAMFTTFLKPFLQEMPVNTDPGSAGYGGYKAWQGFRTIANILLILILLILVLSQLTEGWGMNIVDAYTAKKMAPRILVGIIAINLSIYLCLAAVDITNIIGTGLNRLISGPFVTADTYEFGVNTTVSNSTALVAGGGIFLGAGGLGAITGAAGIFAANPLGILGMLLIIMIPIFFLALAILITIAVRQGLLILLIILSPIAFAAYILPGTEKFFKTWWSFFMKTLLVYPIIAALFAVSDIMGVIMFGSANEGSQLTGAFKIIAGIIFLFAPIVLIPFAFKLAGGIMGQLMNLATTGAQKASDLGPIKNRRAIAKRDLGERMAIKKEAQQRTLQRLGSKEGGRFRSATNWALKSTGSKIGGYNIAEQAAAARKAAKERSDIVTNFGFDDEHRGVTVNKKWAEEQGVGAIHSTASPTGWVNARTGMNMSAENAEIADFRVTEAGTKEYRTLGGAWVNEAAVDAGNKRARGNAGELTAALSYEQSKAITDEQVENIGKKFKHVAMGDGGWNLSVEQAQSVMTAAGYQNQNKHLEFKHTKWNEATQQFELDVKKFVQDAYENRGSYPMAQMSAHTIEQLGNAWRNGNAQTRQQAEAVIETFMSRFGSGSSGIIPGAGDGDITIDPRAIATGARSTSQDARVMSSGSGHVNEAVFKLATEMGINQGIENRPDSTGAPPPPINHQT